MSLAELQRLAARLGEIAERLRDPDLSDEEAERLATEAGELASRAGQEVERAARAAAGEESGSG